MESTTRLSPPPWKTKRCKCKFPPSTGLYHSLDTGYCAVNYCSIILTAVLFLRKWGGTAQHAGCCEREGDPYHRFAALADHGRKKS
jgi:hypothetical protein